MTRLGRRAIAALALLCAGVAATGPATATPGSGGRKVLVLGFDGLDPQVLDSLMETGQMPHFSALAARGDYARLQTVTPPQSPVAWATVITGMDPGGHGIFDFIHRDPITMIPEFSAARVELPERTLNLGVCVVPLESGKVELLRDGVAFWQILDDHGVPATILKMPSNFPPVETGAESLSGMGTPDLLGTYGTFHFFTDDPSITQADVSGGGEIHRVTIENGRVDTQLPGPVNTWKEGEPTSTIPLTAFVDPAHEVVRVDVAGEKLLLAEGEWSPWIRVEFTLCPLVASVQGIVRFHLVQAHPRLMLYASPVNIDPTAPALPISTPSDFAGEIAEGIGLYYTQGMAEDTMALSSGVFADDDFMQQVGLVLDEENRMMDWALDRFDDGLLYVYFSAADLVQHMMWRAMDPEHPMWSPRLQEAHGDAIPSIYRNLDAALGRAIAKVGDDTLVIALSDHGFAPFYREVNLNTWLKDRGYLVLKDPARESATQFLANIDWTRTRAYALGFNGLYINRRGRERWGIVDPGPQAEALMEEIETQLLALRDHATGLAPVARIYRTAQTYHGIHTAEAPDMVVGYRRTYRGSDSSALGGLARPVIQDHLDAWSGDHLMETAAVPGVILSNRKLAEGEKSLVDIAPTLLHAFGIPQPPQMTGRSLLPETLSERK